jgi:replicative DNA helicase
MPVADKRDKQAKHDRLPTMPSSVPVERTVLASILQRDSAIYELVAVGLQDEFFFLDSHRKIFRSMQRLVADRKQPTIISVCDELEHSDELEEIGGPAYLGDLLDGTPEPQSLNQYVEILREKYLRRKIIHLANVNLAAALDLSDPIDWTITRIQDDLLRLQGGVAHEGYNIADFDTETLNALKIQNADEKGTAGLPFGIPALDETTTGIREGEVVVCGGLPASGKTAFACNTIRVIAERGVGVGVFSIEMRKDQLLHRWWAQVGTVPYHKLRNPKRLDLVDIAELEQNYMPQVRQWPIKIDDTSKDIAEIIPRAHLWVRRFNVKLIVVDFLQRIHAPGKTEYEIVSCAIDALTEFAKQTNVPVLVLSQLTRSDDKKNAASQVPTMQQLRASGRIEQNAHLILFTHRPEDEKGDPTGDDLIIVGKQRAGMKGRVECSFNGSSQTWGPREPKR